MKYIEEYVLSIDDELCDAKEYAEKALYWKFNGYGNEANDRYKMYYNMSNQELDHAKNLHTMAVEEINKLKDKGYIAPESMQEMWEKTHKEFVEKTAFVKQILAM